MADPKPLKLKREVVAGRKFPATEFPVARILVDTGVNHLDQPYDYLISKEDSTVVVGALVEVPFSNGLRQGFVIERLAQSDQSSKLKYINKVIANFPLLDEEISKLVEGTAARYGASSWDILPSAIPPRVVKSETKFRNLNILPNLRTAEIAKPRYIQAIGADSLYKLILKSLEDKKFDGQLLVIVPDESDLARVSRELKQLEPLELGSHLPNSIRYENFLTAIYTNPKLIIGTRSAVFTPVSPGSRILIFNDGDESMYDRRYPGWSVRDVAILRSKSHSIIFLSSSPSLEVVRLLNLGWFTKSKSVNVIKNSKLKLVFSDDRRSDLEIIKNGLKSGNVLVSIGEPGYISAFSCQKCRNIAHCECGGRLRISQSGEQPICSICSKIYLNWRCQYCDGAAKRIVLKGGVRLAEEIAKSLPGTRVIISKGGSRVAQIPTDGKGFLVIATYGCEPKGDYSCIVQLNLESLLARVELRSTENARRLIYDNLLLLSVGATAYLSLDQSHPFSQGLLKFDPVQVAQNELSERSSAKLPPNYRIATLEGPKKDLRKFTSAIEAADFSMEVITIEEGAENENRKVLIRTQVSYTGNFSDFIRSLNRYRSIKGLTGISIRVDPYAI